MSKIRFRKKKTGSTPIGKFRLIKAKTKTRRVKLKNIASNVKTRSAKRA
jgi:hypothetical protein